MQLQQFEDSVSARAARPSWRGYGAVTVAVLLIKGAVILYGMYAAHHGALSRRDYEHNFHHHRLISRWTDPQDIRFFELWVVSDAQWHNAIAEEGYPSREQFEAASVVQYPKRIAGHDARLKYAFFPLWGLTLRATQTLLPDVDAAGFVAANSLSLVALLLLYGFLCHRVGPQNAFWTVVLYVASPFGLFFHVPFTESLFLLLAVLTFVACERGSWLPAGMCVGLGIVTRPNGIAMALVPAAFMVAEHIRHPGWLRGQFPRALGFLVAAVPPALLLWHHAARTGNPLVSLEVIRWWGYGQASMLDNLWHNTCETAANFAALPWHGFHRSQLDFIVLAVSALVWFIGLRVVPLHYSSYSLGILIIPLLTKGDLMSFSRYALLAWPLFAVLVLLVRDAYRRWTCAALGSVFLGFQLLNVAEFVNWHWVG